MQSHAFARPKVKFIFKVAGSPSEPWRYSPRNGPGVREVALQLFGNDHVSQCVEHHYDHNYEYTASEPGFASRRLIQGTITLDAILLKPGADLACTFRHSFTSVDSRHISTNKGTIKKLMSTYQEYLASSYRNDMDLKTFKDAFIYLDIKCPPKAYDVNVDPSKSEVIFADASDIVLAFENLCREVYGDKCRNAGHEASSTAGDAIDSAPRNRGNQWQVDMSANAGAGSPVGEELDLEAIARERYLERAAAAESASSKAYLDPWTIAKMNARRDPAAATSARPAVPQDRSQGGQGENFRPILPPPGRLQDVGEKAILELNVETRDQARGRQEMHSDDRSTVREELAEYDLPIRDRPRDGQPSISRRNLPSPPLSGRLLESSEELVVDHPQNSLPNESVRHSLNVPGGAFRSPLMDRAQGRVRALWAPLPQTGRRFLPSPPLSVAGFTESESQEGQLGVRRDMFGRMSRGGQSRGMRAEPRQDNRTENRLYPSRETRLQMEPRERGQGTLMETYQRSRRTQANSLRPLDSDPADDEGQVLSPRPRGPRLGAILRHRSPADGNRRAATPPPESDDEPVWPGISEPRTRCLTLGVELDPHQLLAAVAEVQRWDDYAAGRSDVHDDLDAADFAEGSEGQARLLALLVSRQTT